MGKHDKLRIGPLLEHLGHSRETSSNDPGHYLVSAGVARDKKITMGLDQHQHWAEIDGHESPLVNFITPLFKCLRFIFMTHSKFQFDLKDRAFYFRPGSILRKIIVTTLQLCLIVQLLGEQKLVEGIVRGKNIAGLFKIMGIAYVSLVLGFYYSLMFKGTEICEIMNFLQNMTHSIAGTGCKIPRKKFIKWISMCLLSLYISYSLLFTIVNIDGVHGMSLGDGLSEFLRRCGNQGAREFLILTSSLNISQIREYELSQDETQPWLLLIGLLTFLLHLMSALCWTLAFLMVTMWGLLFWKVLHTFFAFISQSTVRNTKEDIRKFNTITGIIDKFNKAFGWTILTGAGTGILHFSVSIVDLFQDDQAWTHRLAVAIGLLAFGFLLLASAQVNQKAATIIEIIKDRYQEESVWREFHGNCLETTQGMCLIFQEIQSNRIGFTGLGFFTITYSFIGTVLSLISTYSIVVMQFQS